MEAAAYLRKHGVSESSFAAFMDSKKAADTSRFPTDEEFATAIRNRPQYGWIPQHRLKLILEELEFAQRDKFNVDGTLQDGLTIEHIMPQTWETHWPMSDGIFAPTDLTTVDEITRSAIQVRHAVVQTLPNLTLLTPPGNSSASNFGFEAKKVRLQDSLLKTNIAIAAEAQWDEDAMARRASGIIEAAAKLWPAPTGPEHRYDDSE